ncbi:hypothetical protein BVX99_02165 [bacterium F16]|nr:hypothetical protein BVX99_02165 [bacterium F16]
MTRENYTHSTESEATKATGSYGSGFLLHHPLKSSGKRQPSFKIVTARESYLIQDRAFSVKPNQTKPLNPNQLEPKSEKNVEKEFNKHINKGVLNHGTDSKQQY